MIILCGLPCHCQTCKIFTMIKIIKYGFLPINNDRQRGQNISKGQKLFESGHVFDVTETVGQESQEQETILTGKIVAQTKISNVYDVKIIVSILIVITMSVGNHYFYF